MRHHYLSWALLAGLAFVVPGCGDDDDGGTSGRSGASGKGGSGGKGGSAGSSTGGSAGSGTAGAAGSGTAGSENGGSGGSENGSGGSAGSSGGAGGAGGAGGGRTAEFVPPGVGPTLACKGPAGNGTKNAFETYGADNLKLVAGLIVDATVNDLMNNNGSDPSKLGPSFGVLGTPGHLSVADLKTSLGNFLVVAFGGPANTYTGKSMFESHKGLGITKGQYDYFVANIIAPTVIGALAAAAFGGDTAKATDEVNTCMAPALADQKLIHDIVEVP